MSDRTAEQHAEAVRERLARIVTCRCTECQQRDRRISESLDALARLAADTERLREALEPFARQLEAFGDAVMAERLRSLAPPADTEQPVNYTGPHASVQCANPTCGNRLRKASPDQPQFCSKWCRALASPPADTEQP